MKTNTIITLMSLLMLFACAHRGSSEWEDMDYAKIAKENYRRENDSSYTPPTVIGCVDDDLYNCSSKSNYH